MLTALHVESIDFLKSISFCKPYTHINQRLGIGAPLPSVIFPLPMVTTS